MHYSLNSHVKEKPQRFKKFPKAVKPEFKPRSGSKILDLSTMLYQTSTTED